MKCEKPSGYSALCTLDGTLKLMEGNKSLWSVQVKRLSMFVKKCSTCFKLLYFLMLVAS